MINNKFETIIVDQRFVLSRPKISSFKQANEMLECYNDPVMRDFITSSCLPVDIKGAYEMIRYYHDLFINKNGQMWFLEDSCVNNKFIGTFGFHMIDWNSKTAEISYEIHKNYRKQGLSSLCVKLVCKYAINILGIQRIEAVSLIENVASVNFLLKNGFKQEKILHKHQFIHGQLMDFALMTLDI